MTQVKICGINDPTSFDAAVEASADWLGFVFFPPSPRYVTPKAAAVLSGRSSAGPARVGLFVEPTILTIAEVLDRLELDALQIYGPVGDLMTIKQRFNLPIWHAIAISNVTDLPATPWHTDRFVLEAEAPPGADRPGGNATTFDWSILRGWAAPAPWILAGGLTPSNVAAAVRMTGADAVDVSSGVESSRGVKDPVLIRAFIAAVNGT